MNTLQYLKQKQSELGKEATKIANEQVDLEQRLNNNHNRITQLAGAMSEIDKMIRELSKTDETKQP